MSAEASTSAAAEPAAPAPVAAGPVEGDGAAAPPAAATDSTSETPSALDSLSNPELRKKLEASKKELRNYLERKKKIDRELAILEASIHAFEGSYLSDALLPATTAAGNTNAQFGNIIKGYDSYLKAAASGSDRKRGRGVEEARDQDRMFSRSSATFQKAIEMRTAEVALESASEEESVGVSSTRKRRRDR